MDSEQLSIAIARLEEAQKWQKIETQFMKNDMREIKKDVKSLLAYKNKSLGKNYVFSLIISLLTALAVEFARTK
jgi:hypothetical protein